MFSIFKKKHKMPEKKENDYEIELTASVLAYEIARSDGEISNDELLILMEEIEKIAIKVDKDKDKIMNMIEIYSQDSTSFYDFIQDINKNFSKKEKLDLLEFMWRVAYADNKLDVDEERLIRRVADLIKIKDLEILRLKDKIRN
jgi:uncharacterized tellurite resistance protein B-like protein